MPHAPFARLLALALVGAVAFFLLWPDPRSHEWGLRALPVAPLLLAIFTWAAVRGAPPFDDRAFHRTLPPDPGTAFRRVFGILLLMAAGIGVAAAGYAWHFHLGGMVMAWAAALTAIPVAAWTSACGLAFSLGTTTERGKSWGYMAIFATPVFSAFILYGIRDGFFPEEPDPVWLTGMRTMILAAALLYPAIWWLVAARGRHRMGLMLGGWTGALMPWLFIHGQFLRVPTPDRDRLMEKWETAHPPATFARLPVPEIDGAWIDAERLIRVDGLAAGEFTFFYHFEPWGGRIVRPRELKNGVPGRTIGALIGREDDGSTVWGFAGLWSHLARRAKPGASVAFPDAGSEPGERIAFPADDREIPVSPSRDMTPAEGDLTFAKALHAPDWRVAGGEKIVWRTLGVFDAAKGGSARLPGGGLIRAIGMNRSGNAWRMALAVHSPDFQSAEIPPTDPHPDFGVPWPGPLGLLEEEGSDRLIAVDFRFERKNPPRLLASVEHYSFTGRVQPDLPLERLRRMRLHLFWPECRGAFSQDSLPAAMPE